MSYIIESLFVGVYCGILYEIMVNFIGDYQVLLFVLGFIKHYLGYESGLHGMFCKFGYACQRVENSYNKIAQIDKKTLILESLAEGFAFLFL